MQSEYFRLWYLCEPTLTKSCPACGGEHGYNETMVLKGLDDFLSKINRIRDDTGSDY